MSHHPEDYMRTETITEETICCVQARKPGGDWDADYVGAGDMPLREARQYVAELRRDPDWAGWELRIVTDNDDGVMMVEVAP